MAREAPRKISRSEKKQLADMRRAGIPATETDVYNMRRSWLDNFMGAVNQARAIPMEAAAPIESRTSYAPGRALQGLIGRSGEAPTGIGMARSGAFGQPIPERTLRFGDNTFYPDYYRGEGEYSPAVIGQAIKNNPRLAAEATALGILSEFGRVTGTGEGMQEFIKDQGDGIIRRGTTMSMEDEFTKPASWVDYVSAGSWFVPGVGFTKPAMLAAKAGRAVGKAAMRSPKLAGAGLAGGAAAYGLSGGTEEAEGFSLSAARNLTRAARTGGRTRTELDRIQRQINKTTDRNLKRLGLESKGSGLSKKEIQRMIDDYFNDPRNQTYINSIADEDNPFAFVGAHSFGNPPQLGGQRNPERITSGILNRLEMDMRRAGGSPESSEDVMLWAIKNNPKYSGMTIEDMIKIMGV